MEKGYWLGRKRASVTRAREASSAEARLVHLDLAGRYSVRAASCDAPPSGELPAANPESEISEAELEALIPRFYQRVREDTLIGPVFDGAIADWDTHLEKLVAFWSSVMLTSGRYKGNPVAAHLQHLPAIRPAMFDRWLALWAEVTGEVLSPAVATALQAKAARIAESLKLALYFRLAPATGSPAAAPTNS